MNYSQEIEHRMFLNVLGLYVAINITFIHCNTCKNIISEVLWHHFFL